jgi:hypothetical protein
MNYDLEPQLRALADKYRERRFHLSKEDSSEATKLCTRLLQDRREGFDLCWQFAPFLPAESLAEAIASTWTNLDELLRREFIARQQRLPEAAGSRLRLRSAVALRLIDPPAARRLLTSACYAMTNNAKKCPSKEQVKIFRSILLNGNEPGLLGFTFESHTQAEIGPLLSCVVEVLSTSKVDTQRIFTASEPRVIEWLLRNTLFNRLTADQRTVVATLAKSWPREVKAAFASKYEPLPEGLDEALKIVATPTPPIAEAESALRPDVPPLTAVPQRCHSVQELLDQIGLAVKAIDADNKSAREELTEKEVVLQALRTRLSQAESSLQRTEGELIESSAALNEKGAALQTALAELAELRGKIDTSALELTSEKKKHAADAKTLLDRIEVERRRAVEAFENGLANKLRLEWRDFESVKDRPMDTQMGESMRSLVRGIFELLENEGIKIHD